MKVMCNILGDAIQEDQAEPFPLAWSFALCVIEKDVTLCKYG